VTTDVIDLVREELRFDLRSALHRAFEQGEASLSVPIIMRLEGEISCGLNGENKVGPPLTLRNDQALELS
jgi:hypothetical protein